MTNRQQVFRDQKQPLLVEEEGQDFVCYDDDDLAAAAKLKRKRTRIRAYLWISAGIFIVALVGVGLFFGTRSMKSDSPNKHSEEESEEEAKYKHAAVASDVTQCSEIGRDILEMDGGNAVDAALATLLCMGLADPQSMGIGGGFFMTIYNRTTGESHMIDARETAPSLATVDMFYDGTSSSTGGLSIAVPGEIRGYQMAHTLYGSLPWEHLFQPALKMAADGFVVPKSLAEALQSFKNGHEGPDFSTKYPEFSETYTNPETKELYKEGETIKLVKLHQTLQILATEGPAAFYDGSLTQDILQDMRQNNSGAIINEEDLRLYTPVHNKSTEVGLENGYTIYTPGTPSGGVVLMFILNILDGYKMTPEMLTTTNDTILAYHRMIEAFKFAYAKRTDLGDGAFADMSELVKNLTSKDYAEHIRAKIWDNQTHDIEYYGATFYTENKTSTAHLSVVDQQGNAVAITSTVNLRFGSNVIGSKTGIVFNDEMDDFATSDKPNDFGLYPSPANKIVPGKRPLSSMCPAVFVDKDGDARLVVGAAGGSRITTATAFVAAQVLWFGEDIKAAIDRLRIHHQLLPPEFSYEEGMDEAIITGLKDKGHNATMVAVGKSIVQGIARDGGFLYANSDFRKGGKPAGF